MNVTHVFTLFYTNFSPDATLFYTNFSLDATLFYTNLSFFGWGAHCNEHQNQRRNSDMERVTICETAYQPRRG